MPLRESLTTTDFFAPIGEVIEEWIEVYTDRPAMDSYMLYWWDWDSATFTPLSDWMSQLAKGKALHEGEVVVRFLRPS